MFTLFWSVGMVGSIYEKTGRSTISSDCPFNVPLISVCRAGAEQPREQGAGWLLGPGHLPPHSWCGDQGMVFSDLVPTARATGICWHLSKHMYEYIFLLEFFSKAFYILIHFPSWIRTRIRIQYAGKKLKNARNLVVIVLNSVILSNLFCIFQLQKTLHLVIFYKFRKAGSGLGSGSTLSIKAGSGFTKN